MTFREDIIWVELYTLLVVLTFILFLTNLFCFGDASWDVILSLLLGWGAWMASANVLYVIIMVILGRQP